MLLLVRLGTKMKLPLFNSNSKESDFLDLIKPDRIWLPSSMGQLLGPDQLQRENSQRSQWTLDQ